MKFIEFNIAVNDKKNKVILEKAYVNPDCIAEFHYLPEYKETVVTIHGTGKSLYVKETPDEIIKAIS